MAILVFLLLTAVFTSAFLGLRIVDSTQPLMEDVQDRVLNAQ